MVIGTGIGPNDTKSIWLEEVMAYRDLLVHLDDSKACAQRIDAAIRLADQCGAHLTALYPIVEIPLLHYIQSELPREVRAQMEVEAQAGADAALGQFRAAAQRSGIAHDARTARALSTTLAQVVAMHAGYSDLVILGQAAPEERVDFGRHLPEQVVLSSGRPVLVVPYIGPAATLGRRVVVAWDAGREAARAVGGAMPILEQAQSVQVVCVEPESISFGHGEVPGADLGVHLARQGVKVEVQRVEAGELSVTDSLLSRIADCGADLLVMGAYGHSRLRELVLGGTTRGILESMTVPVLMAH